MTNRLKMLSAIIVSGAAVLGAQSASAWGGPVIHG